MKILEIGPASHPATEYIEKFPGSQVTFVGMKGEQAKFDYARNFPESLFFATGFLTFVSDLADAMGPYNTVIASNVLNLPFEGIDIERLAVAAHRILVAEGKLIVEHTLDLSGENIANHYSAALSRRGFGVQKYLYGRGNDGYLNMFVRPDTVRGTGRGFSIHATKL